MPEENKPEENKPEENEPKSTDEMMDAATTYIQYLKGEGFAVEEAICVLALASSFLQVELFMRTLLKDAKIVKMPIPMLQVNKPSSN